MRKILNWIFAQLGKIGKDKYQHFTLGAIITAVVFVVVAFIGRADVAWWLALIVTFVVELAKEFAHDYAPDPKDILATMLGWAAVGVPLFIMIF